MKHILQDSFKPAESLSMVDLLQAERENEIQAQHLSKTCGKHLNKCTYSKGYINQPVFVCLTCYNNNNNHNSNNNNNSNNTNTDINYDLLPGFCLGCSMNCHLEHNIIELWDKRNFKCDCGNSKFINTSQKECLLSCKKDSINILNKYNHNFIGKYCYCNREYNASEDTMHQCLNCQDWFHQTCIILYHLKINKYLKKQYDQKQIQIENHDNNHNNNANDEAFFEYFRKLLIPQSKNNENCFDSFICKDCAIKYDYLFVPYRWKTKPITNNDINNNNVPLTKKEKVTGMKRNFSDMSSDSIDDDMKRKNNESNPPSKRRKLNNEMSEMKTNECKGILLNENERENVLGLIGGGLWFENNWIHKLCQCKQCNDNIYNNYGLKWLFVEDIEDENDDEEEQGNVYDLNIPKQELSREFSTDAMIADSINKLPRQQTLDALNIMLKGTDIIKQKLFQYIRLNPKKIIDQNDIHNIFKT